MTIHLPTPLVSPSAKALSHLMVQSVCAILDELSAQGLLVWFDEEEKQWHWHWRDTGKIASGGFWALGEAVADALISRFPEAFAGCFEP